MGYTKLFSSIITSTIWCKDHATVRVWIAMLALKNWDGIVEGSVPGFAHLARVSIPEMEKALTVLMSADPHSRTPDNDGRRIEAIPNGWRILNHSKYNFMDSPDHKREMSAERQRRRRHALSRSVTLCHAPSPHTDTDLNKSLKTSTIKFDGWEEFWKNYPRKTAKQAALKAFKKLSPGPDLLKEMLSALRVQAGTRAWRKDGGIFIPHPATWINGRRWEDEINEGGRAGEASFKPGKYDHLEKN